MTESQQRLHDWKSGGEWDEAAENPCSTCKVMPIASVSSDHWMRMCSEYYETVREAAVLALLVLEGWNDEMHGSTFAFCVIVEGIIISFLMFQAFSSLIIRRLERWGIQEMLENRQSQSLALTSEEMFAAFFKCTTYDVQPGVFVAAAAVS